MRASPVQPITATAAHDEAVQPTRAGNAGANLGSAHLEGRNHDGLPGGFATGEAVTSATRPTAASVVAE
eukprot:15484798-Alexandrium_andersonii.AAC.1